jgi:hypothetical protein
VAQFETEPLPDSCVCCNGARISVVLLHLKRILLPFRRLTTPVEAGRSRKNARGQRTYVNVRGEIGTSSYSNRQL